MNMLPLFVNALVIGVLAAELVATALGVITADQLLVVSAISGGLTIFSFRLSKEALEHLNGVPDSALEQSENKA